MINSKLQLSIISAALLVSPLAIAAPDKAGMTLWLDASAGSTILFTKKDCTVPSSATANAVKCWKDKSGKNNHVTLAPNILEPALLSAVSNGMSAVSFSNTALVTSEKGQIKDSYTKFVVFKINDEGGSKDANKLAKHNLIGSDPYQTTLWADNGMLHSSHDKGITNYLDSTTKLGTTKFHVAATRYSKPDKKVLPNILKLDGKEEDRNYDKADHQAARTSIGGVGSQGNGDSYFYLNGDIAEAIIYDRSLSDIEVNEVEKYLAEKWSLTLGQNIYFEKPKDWELQQGEIQLHAFASSGLPVSYSSTTTTICDISKDKTDFITLKKVGKCTVKATSKAEAPYATAANATQSFNIKTNGSGNGGGGTGGPDNGGDI